MGLLNQVPATLGFNNVNLWPGVTFHTYAEAERTVVADCKVWPSAKTNAKRLLDLFLNGKESATAGRDGTK